jgi:glycosyltransferase involved in cell wall biosynthesis
MLEIPLISVLMPCYNSSAYINEAIKSILNQTIKDFELLIFDDASTDNTIQNIRSFDDVRIKLIEKPNNTGYTDSLNMGLKIARGKYIARMDSDDVSLETRFQKQVHFLDLNPDIVVCGTWIETFPDNTIVKYPKKNEEIMVSLLDDCCLAHPSVFIRRSFLVDEGAQYDKDFEPAEDYDLWTRLISKGKFANIPEVLLKYRVHPQQTSSSRYYSQQNNSLRSRQRMLNYLIDDGQINNLELSHLVYQTDKIDSNRKLLTLIDWLDTLVILNDQKQIFDRKMFRDFVNRKKNTLTSAFYLRRLNYSPLVLVELLIAGNRVIRNFEASGLIKLFVKSLLFRRLSGR